MKNAIIAIAAITIIGCKESPSSRREKVENAVRLYIKSELKQQDSSLVVDSINFIRIDTLTARTRFYAKASKCTQVSDSLSREMDYVNEVGRSHLKMARLASGFSPKLYNLSMDDVKEDSAKMGGIIRASEQNTATLKELYARIDKADSVKFEHYQSVGTYQISRGVRLVKKDTFRVVVTNDFKILTWQQYLSL